MDLYGRHNYPEYIDLSSDHDEDDHAEGELGRDGVELPDLHAPPEQPLIGDAAFGFLNLSRPHNQNQQPFIDLTALENIPDVDVPPDKVPDSVPSPDRDADLISPEVCLRMILDVLPDIAVTHARDLVKEKTQDASRTPIRCEQLISEILDAGTYPKEEDEIKSHKRKRSIEDDDFSEFENGSSDITAALDQNAVNLLKDEFLDIPVKHLAATLLQEKTLFKAYSVVAEQNYSYTRGSSPFQKILKARPKRNFEDQLVRSGSQLPKELQAARKKSENILAKRRKLEEEERAEEENLTQARMRNEMGECQCCFGDFPINRMTACSGETAHIFCLDCAKKYVETEMGSARCRPVCFADIACRGTFTRSQLQNFLGQVSFERLEHLQQQQEIAAAGLDDLSECPFCDYKAEYPPVEVDREFRCLNPKCHKVSCRLCDKVTHIPLSCEEAKKDGKLTIRHVVEEAMSAALIRHCNKCKNPFVKEHGCNKMTCTKCSNTQCYVCSKDVDGYNHFSDSTASARCPLHDNVEDRHEIEVKKAAEKAMAKVRSENPDISEADLMVKVSDSVKEAEQARKGRAQVAHNGFPYRMQGDMLVHDEAVQPDRPGGHPLIGVVPARHRFQVVDPHPPHPIQFQAALFNPPPPADPNPWIGWAHQAQNAARPFQYVHPVPYRAPPFHAPPAQINPQVFAPFNPPMHAPTQHPNGQGWDHQGRDQPRNRLQEALNFADRNNHEDQLAALHQRLQRRLEEAHERPQQYRAIREQDDRRDLRLRAQHEGGQARRAQRGP